MRTLAIALGCVLALAACKHAPPPAPEAAATASFGWKTLKAEHRVTVDVELEGGKHERRQLRGVIAIERPDRFRLRALGPGGISLFDLLWVAGKTSVLQAIRDPHESALGPVIEAMAGDLSAAFLLEPAPPGRVAMLDAGALVVSEPERTVRERAFVRVNGQLVPTRIEIENRARHYRVEVDARGSEVDVPLDAALFRE
jgi:hypothetical protein